MTANVNVIDPETGGGVPVVCELKVEDNRLLICKNGRKGFIIAVELKDVVSVLHNDRSPVI